MDTFVQDHEAIIRLGSFVGIFLVMAAWEVLAPRRTRTLSRLVRWTNNLGLVALNTVVVRLIFPAAAVGMAAYASARDWGDRKSTRLNSSHVKISYAVFCLKKKRTVQDTRW